MNPVPERLAALRKKMQENNVAFYIVPTDDFHQDEYVGDHFKARVYITGFTGSAGTALITETEAFLWTDGRYFIQAAKELEDSTVELMKMSEPGVPTISQFLKEHVKPGQTLGFDGRTLSMDEGTGYRDAAEKAGGAVRYDLDLIDEIWEDRPPMSDKPAWLLPVEYAGKTAEDKIRDIREKMAEAGADVHVETTPDDICWTLNIRGDDIDYFPLMLSYALITADAYHLYVDDKKLSPEIGQYLKDLGVTVHPYNDVYEDAKKISGAVMVDPNKVNYALYHNIPADCTKINVMSPEETFKTVKNPVEVSNIRKAEIKDSVAHIRFMKWLKENVGKIRITEISASDKLDEFRAEMGNFIKPSFEPISSYAEHAAIVHYAPTPETDAELKPEGMLLTDTGAGFWEGSTDITRTYVLGPITQKMKEDFTVVAISNLSLGNAVFTKGITGVALDNLARNPFWKRRMNYNHGTGHGVGYLLNIHESPASFRSRFVEGDTAILEEGMVITDEPGFYVEGSHGIRLENELLVVNDVANEFGQFMRLEPITFVPFDLDAIEPEIMTAEERTMLNDYHKKVYEITSPYLNDEEKEWLRKYTREV
ncbi:aminopeptidase P family N-terminal domain-containing protein [Eubacterium pyruvativorans]|uniref:aminopeptidase P family N-terminal domain-containing protein n=1 Tax=Eubacterium pyruvativorans TaxID=155865 RepID=UPI0015651F77|nr:aminopeptidase P family N-terminal domain-containing protein [Eubacterium pyruvativorans]MCI5747375.1 aminopeptidase P family N-terminal domain-containing protein [Eubacterium pyruvativorans]MDD7684950.1 aminopeptidase P family N-terminal domain-containing protein [Eubacterium pyruvativorans]